jgi:hypothetical protein
MLLEQRLSHDTRGGKDQPKPVTRDRMMMARSVHAADIGVFGARAGMRSQRELSARGRTTALSRIPVVRTGRSERQMSCFSHKR